MKEAGGVGCVRVAASGARWLGEVSYGEVACVAWCLEELVKIIECRKNNRQIVVLVFYLVDSSHVRNQTGSFRDAFARLVKERALAMDKLQSLRGTSKDAANLSGWGLGKFE
ncbi:unnamed protein product [Dovyalis caffra]|uniref:TIR domain-containing protein n=1 Tax=Dovyalis caffra TaxID=77055 RepID=A0AAV1QNG1_9ROSI|nr:unnamed protein product [Dovyalis caffra]